ncbi:hypothetical protein M1X78_003064 [Escherichia coli]|nr:hypothetical protein [Escherichia coli]
MKQMSLIEMDGFLKGKCFPRDLKVNETNAEYLVRKFGELESKLETALRECRSAGITIDNLDAKCAALAAESAVMKAGHSYFSYGSEHNFEWHKTAEEAIESAEAAIDDYRGDACDGWSEEVDSICWGIIMQSSTKVGERPRNEDDCCDPAIDTICDYALLPNIETPATDAFLAEIRAEARNEGINYTASRLAAAFNHGFINKSLREVFDVTRMILSAKEELANEAHPIDGLSGEYAEKSLEEWAEQIRKGSSQ